MWTAPDLAVTLAVCLGIQAVFFAVAATFKTDKVTDLSYSLTFIVVAMALWTRKTAPNNLAALILAGMVIAWGARLAGYLFFRILHMKRDVRFDGIREHFWPFFKFWFFQGLAVWLIMLPVTLWFRAPGAWSRFSVAGVLIWGGGLIVETVADAQKFAHKRTRDAKWTSTGVWRFSRHPNYFGELLCWWGVFVFVSGDLAGANLWLGLIGPLSITGVLLFLTGVPQLEASADRKWGRDRAYQEYKRRTSLLVPWPLKR
jgi:steroid 5-alpha reductase family enzyme